MAEQIVTEVRLDEAVAALKRKTPTTVVLGEKVTARELLWAIQELKRHRKLEEAHYWGEDDD